MPSSLHHSLNVKTRKRRKINFHNSNMEEKSFMNSNTFPSKLNFFGVFSLIVMLSVFSSLAYGAATVSPASSIFIAGSSNNDVTINITGATANSAIVITPPTGWNGTGVTGATGGAGTGAITVTPAAASVTVVYSATAGTTV
ncbi:TPA: hypothetical protein DHW51_20370, partial [Candidatus Poribacteria bacterium]|nr:hypothetical protein [Candidatus Poribacteria bacterium]